MAVVGLSVFLFVILFPIFFVFVCLYICTFLQNQINIKTEEKKVYLYKEHENLYKRKRQAALPFKNV